MPRRAEGIGVSAYRRGGVAAWRRLESIINFIETCYADTLPHGDRTPV
jgi:hypothetical protein